MARWIGAEEEGVVLYVGFVRGDLHWNGIKVGERLDLRETKALVYLNETDEEVHLDRDHLEEAIKSWRWSDEVNRIAS